MTFYIITIITITIGIILNITIILIIPIIIAIITRRSAAVVDHLVSKDLALLGGGQLLQQLLQANIFVSWRTIIDHTIICM